MLSNCERVELLENVRAGTCSRKKEIWECSMISWTFRLELQIGCWSDHTNKPGIVPVRTCTCIMRRDKEKIATSCCLQDYKEVSTLRRLQARFRMHHRSVCAPANWSSVFSELSAINDDGRVSKWLVAVSNDNYDHTTRSSRTSICTRLCFEAEPSTISTSSTF